MGYTIFHAGELDWQPRRPGDPRLAAELSDAMTNSRANLFRYPPGAVGRRHIDPIQEEVFVVMDGTLTIDMGEDDGIEQHELATGQRPRRPAGHGAAALEPARGRAAPVHRRSPAGARRDGLPRSGLTVRLEVVGRLRELLEHEPVVLEPGDDVRLAGDERLDGLLDLRARAARRGRRPAPPARRAGPRRRGRP